MMSLIARYSVKPGEVDAVLAALREMAEHVARDEPTCLTYRVGEPIDAQDTLVLYEEYTDVHALEAHRETPHYRRFIAEQVGPLLRDKHVETMSVEIGGDDTRA